MRRLLCVTALLLLSACSSPSEDAAAPTAAPSQAQAAPAASTAPTAPGSSSASAAAPDAPAASGDAALKNDTDAICTQASKTSAAAGKTFAADIKLLIEAESGKDAASIGQAQGKTARDVDNFSFALVDMANLASDPELKTVLSEMAKEVASLKGDVRKLDAEKLAGLQESLAKVCGTA
ncbi:hypothetical protein [Actinoplanes sp. NPDC051494]|uniref:hypothetical protein n=1 Tax=Actinoplanes sp. NPDC051494 TaxID=3363907 RepID=UPI0037A54865